MSRVSRAVKSTGTSQKHHSRVIAGRNAGILRGCNIADFYGGFFFLRILLGFAACEELRVWLIVCDSFQVFRFFELCVCVWFFLVFCQYEYVRLLWSKWCFDEFRVGKVAFLSVCRVFEFLCACIGYLYVWKTFSTNIM